MQGYGSGLDKVRGILTFAEDAEAKRKLIAMSKEKRFLAETDKKFLRTLWKNMCKRRLTARESSLMEALRARKVKNNNKF